MTHAIGTLEDMLALQAIESRVNGLPAPGVGVINGPPIGWTMQVRDVVQVDGDVLSLPEVSTDPVPIGKPRPVPRPVPTSQALLDAQASGDLYAYPVDDVDYVLGLASEEDAMTLQYHLDNAVELVVAADAYEVPDDSFPSPVQIAPDVEVEI